MNVLIQSFIIAFLTIGIFLLTRNPTLGIYSPHLTLFSLLVFVVYIIFARKKDRSVSETKTFTYLLLTVVLFLLGTTHWFFSPFFFLLYFLAILLAFIFPKTVTVVFVATIVLLLMPNIGEVDPTYDTLIILSFLMTLPLSFYLRGEYLRLKEKEKKILILEKEKKEYQTKVDEILANTINKVVVDLRQPVNDVKQISYMLLNSKSKEGLDKNVQRMIASSNEALEMLSKFEKETTGRGILSNPVVNESGKE